MYGSLLTCLCVLLMVLQSTGHERRTTRGARRYCGDNLTSSLSVLCNGYYKRVPSATNYLDDYDEPRGEEELLRREETSSFRQRREVMSMMRNRKFRQRRGVVSECCHKACTLSELMTYCGKLED